MVIRWPTLSLRISDATATAPGLAHVDNMTCGYHMAVYMAVYMAVFVFCFFPIFLCRATPILDFYICKGPSGQQDNIRPEAVGVASGTFKMITR